MTGKPFQGGNAALPISMQQIVVFCLYNSYFRGKPIKIYELTCKVLTYGKLFPRIQFLKLFFPYHWKCTEMRLDHRNGSKKRHHTSEFTRHLTSRSRQGTVLIPLVDARGEPRKRHGRTVQNVSKKPFNPCLDMSRTTYLQHFRSIKRYNLVSVSTCSVQFDYFLRRYSSLWLLWTCPVSWYKVWMTSETFMQWGGLLFLFWN